MEDRRLLAFDLAVDYSTGTGPSGVVTADFNHDGRMDVATANQGSNNVSVLLGSADGSFQAAQEFPTGAGPTSIAVGDFDADGHLDVATANFAGNVSVLLGSGASGFAAPLSVALQSQHVPLSVAVGDLNADGKMDLAVGAQSSYFIPPWGGGYGCYYGSCGGCGGYYINLAHVNVLLGTGDGGFGIQSFYNLSGDPWGSAVAVAVADLNGDGRADVTTAAQGPVQVLLGNGDGTLQSPLHFSQYGGDIAIADMDGDGKLDLVTSGGSIGVALGNGLGAFGAPQYFAGGVSPTSVASADFNGDGKADLVVSDHASNTVNVLLGAGAGAGMVAFKPPVNAAAGTGPFAVAIGDFNGDGLIDAVSANSGTSNVSVLLNDGTWSALDAPWITINDVTVTEGNTGTVSADFTVSLSSAYDQTVTVNFATADGSAMAGSDYQAASGIVTFAPGVTSHSISVLVDGDRLGESYGESFFVKLSDPTNAFIADTTGVGTILDDEPYLYIADYNQTTEGNTGTTPLIVTVMLSALYDEPVTVDYATADLTLDEQYWYGPGATAGMDYTATSGTLTIPAGQISGTFAVPVIGDRLPESYEYFFVNLNNASGAQLSTSQGLGTIIDDEPYVSMDPSVSPAVVEGDSGTTAMTFSVVLSAASDVPVTVDYVTNDGSAVAGSDYQATAGTVTFSPGEVAQVITVLVIGDTEREFDEYFSVNLSNATSASLGTSYAFGHILDDDSFPALSISDASVVEGNSGKRNMTFTVSLSEASTQTLKVNYRTADGTAEASDNDYVAKSGTLTFRPGETIKTISISVKGDKKVENDEYFYVNLSSASGAPIEDGQGEGTVINDDLSTRKGRHPSHASAFDAALDDFFGGHRKKRGW